MRTPWINRLGHWNPQLLREFRGRIKPRSVIAAIAASAIAQILLLLIFSQDTHTRESEQWLNLWRSIVWLLIYALFSLGSYYIVTDLTQEEKRGTLNFIRLSPRPAWQILLGKMLGVPVLPYLTVLSAIPLHLFAAVKAGVPLALTLSVYLVLIAGCLLCYSAAMLYALAGGTARSGTQQATTAVSFAAIAALFFVPLFMYWNIGVTWRPFNLAREFFIIPSGNLFWCYTVLNRQVWISHGFTLLNIGISTYLIWQMLLRRFRQPRSTIMSKRQSYAIVAYLEVLALGFSLRPMTPSIRSESIPVAYFMAVFTAVMLIVLMVSICPQRQALLDWAQNPTQSWQSRIWADKSPALTAFVIQISIASALLLPWLLITRVATEMPLVTGLSFMSIANALLIFGVFTQQIAAAKIRNPLAWVGGGLIIWLAVLPAILGLLRFTPDQVFASIALWTFLGYPFWSFTSLAVLPFGGLGIVAQWLLLAFLVWRLQQTLRRLQMISQSQGDRAAPSATAP